MKKSPITFAIGAVLMIIFVLLTFVFQVRKSEVAVVTTFGKVTDKKTEPGPYLKWPWPIQKVHKLDQRIQNFDDARGFPPSAGTSCSPSSTRNNARARAITGAGSPANRPTSIP